MHGEGLWYCVSDATVCVRLQAGQRITLIPLVRVFHSPVDNDLVYIRTLRT